VGKPQRGHQRGAAHLTLSKSLDSSGYLVGADGVLDGVQQGCYVPTAFPLMREVGSQ